MILWTIQPEELYRRILETGIYICDPQQCSLPEYSEMYDWLAEQMKARIGNPPDGVVYPVWAWYRNRGKRQKPDLRSERWANGSDRERFVCMEIEVPDAHVLLSDFDAWNIVLNNGLISETEAEDHELDQIYQTLSPEKQREMKHRNWERVFDISPLDNDWLRRGWWIQANFWLLTKEMIREVRYFTSANRSAFYTRVDTKS